VLTYRTQLTIITTNYNIHTLKLNKLDNYDMKILAILTIDCRTPDRQIGKTVGLSGVSVKSRIAETGIIKGGLEMAGLGTGVALIGFGIGNELANLGIINI